MIHNNNYDTVNTAVKESHIKSLHEYNLQKRAAIACIVSCKSADRTIVKR